MGESAKQFAITDGAVALGVSSPVPSVAPTSLLHPSDVDSESLGVGRWRMARLSI